MKRISLIIYFLFLTFFSQIICVKNRFSQSFTTLRPVNFNVSAQQAFWHNIIYCNPKELDTSAQFIGFYQESSSNRNTDKSRKISEYFLMDDRPVLSIKGDSVITSTVRDVRAEWLNLPDNFDGTFSVFPEQRQIGFLIDFKQDLSTFFCESFFNSFWFGMSTAILSVDNNLNLREAILSNTNPIFTPIKSLTSPQLLFSKFFDKSASMGFSELRFKIGTEFIFREDFQINAHTYLMIPLIDKPPVNKVFPAVRGFNGHVGIGTVVNFQIPLTLRCSDYLVALFIDAESIFLFRNKQLRSFDLRNKQWSRYMLLNNKDGTLVNYPAVNVLTRCVKVDPYCFVDFSTGFRYKYNHLEAEVGYSVWAHPDERLKFVGKFQNEWGIAAKTGDLTPAGFPATASRSTISQLAETDKDEKGNNIFVPIRENDIDLLSGAARATIVQRMYFALGYSNRGQNCNGFFGVGTYYEFPQNNASLQQWGFWVKVGATF